jgi:hypothetical protein
MRRPWPTRGCCAMEKKKERLCGFPPLLLVRIIIKKNPSVYNFTPYKLRNWHRVVNITKEQPTITTQ